MSKNLDSKLLSQCHGCWRSGLQLPKGTNLSKCGRCKAALYCSKECQKAAWPGHKAICNEHSSRLALVNEIFPNDPYKKITAYALSHRPLFHRFGAHALELNVDVTRGLREVLLIEVQPNPKWDGDGSKKKIGTAFIAEDVNVVPLETFPQEIADEMRVNLQNFHDDQKRVGYEGGFMLLFCDLSTGMTINFGLGFAKGILDDFRAGQAWKGPLLHALNNGIAM